MLVEYSGWVAPGIAALAGAAWGLWRHYGTGWTLAAAVAAAALSSAFAIPAMLFALVAMVGVPEAGEDWALPGIVLTAVAWLLGGFLGLALVAGIRRSRLERRGL